MLGARELCTEEQFDCLAGVFARCAGSSCFSFVAGCPGPATATATNSAVRLDALCLDVQEKRFIQPIIVEAHGRSATEVPFLLIAFPAGVSRTEGKSSHSASWSLKVLSSTSRCCADSVQAIHQLDTMSTALLTLTQQALH